MRVTVPWRARGNEAQWTTEFWGALQLQGLHARAEERGGGTRRLWQQQARQHFVRLQGLRATDVLRRDVEMESESGSACNQMSV
jgi:hypothetical protein